MLCEMAGRKRKLDEWDVSEMEESEGATVHGVFTELSSVKVSRRNASVRYYDGRMADGQKSEGEYLCLQQSQMPTSAAGSDAFAEGGSPCPQNSQMPASAAFVEGGCLFPEESQTQFSGAFAGGESPSPLVSR